MENQSADVVSSASAVITVPAVKKAVNNCIAQAMGLAAATVARYNELAQKGVDEDFLQRQLSGVLCRRGRRPHDDPGPLGCEGDFGKRVRTNGMESKKSASRAEALFSYAKSQRFSFKCLGKPF